VNWIVQTYLRDPVAKTGRWVTYRHRDGSKAVARFTTLGALRRFVKHHCLALGQRCRAHNEVTHEYAEISQ
jgi:hypothetical protein